MEVNPSDGVISLRDGVISFGWSYNFFQKLELYPFGIGIISPITESFPFERS
jgi:hypothetical protein